MDRAKAIRNRNKAQVLNRNWNVGAVQARFRETGDWYAALTKFPAALFDANGYLFFDSEDFYLNSPYIRIAKQISVTKPGISAVPGYVRMAPSDPLVGVDLDIHELEASEGTARLVLHLRRERDQGLVRAKRKHAGSSSCEVCCFSFERTYGNSANGYCEVHHLVPLSESKAGTKTRLKDLALLCANCHRVVHLRYPPYSLEEVRSLRSIAEAEAKGTLP